MARPVLKTPEERIRHWCALLVRDRDKLTGSNVVGVLSAIAWEAQLAGIPSPMDFWTVAKRLGFEKDQSGKGLKEVQPEEPKKPDAPVEPTPEAPKDKLDLENL